jgi:hypothetical protein
MKYRYKTRKNKKQRGGEKTIPGIPGILRVGDTEIKYMKKCNKEKVMCDKNTKNYALCVNLEEDCDNVDYEYEYIPTNPKDPNGLIEISGTEINPKGVERFHIEYDEEGNTLGGVEKMLAKRVLESDVRINEQTGRRKAYAPDFHPTSCYIQKKGSISHSYKDVDEESNIGSPFSIVTQNALGLYRGKEEDQLDESNPTDRKNKAILDIMKLRTAYLRKLLSDYGYPAFVCFQEMTTHFFDFLYKEKRDMINNYPYVYPTIEDFDELKSKGADATVMLMSRYPAKKTTTYMLQGNSSYYNALGVYEFNNLIIFNCYLQAGSEISPGQKYNWENYSRCRRQQLMFIKDIIDKSGSGKAVIVLGDFNSELNALGYEGKPKDIDKWSELKFLEDLELQDSFRDINPSDPGLTENTDINSLRFLGKLEEKALRYDGIFYNNLLNPTNSTVVSNIGLPLNDEIPSQLDITEYNKTKINEQYKDAMVFEPPKENKAAIEKKNEYMRTHPGLNDVYELFVSDHFGVMTTFEFVGGKGGRRKKHVTRRRKNKNKQRRTKRCR